MIRRFRQRDLAEARYFQRLHGLTRLKLWIVDHFVEVEHRCAQEMAVLQKLDRLVAPQGPAFEIALNSSSGISLHVRPEAATGANREIVNTANRFFPRPYSDRKLQICEVFNQE